jgi:hypothetical protein
MKPGVGWLPDPGTSGSASGVSLSEVRSSVEGRRDYVGCYVIKRVVPLCWRVCVWLDEACKKVFDHCCAVHSLPVLAETGTVRRTLWQAEDIVIKTFGW